MFSFLLQISKCGVLRCARVETVTVEQKTSSSRRTVKRIGPGQAQPYGVTTQNALRRRLFLYHIHIADMSLQGHHVVPVGDPFQLGSIESLCEYFMNRLKTFTVRCLFALKFKKWSIDHSHSFKMAKLRRNYSSCPRMKEACRLFQEAAIRNLSRLSRTFGVDRKLLWLPSSLNNNNYN